MPKRKGASLYPARVAFTLISLSLALYLFFSLWPIAYSIYIAFTDANNINIASEPRVRELLAQKSALTSYLTSNKDNILKQAYQADKYLGDAISSLTEMRSLILTSNPQNFSLSMLSSLRSRVDEALTYASSIVRSNATLLYYYRGLGNTLYRAVSLVDGGIWSDLDRILGFKLVVSDKDVKQLRETVVPEIDQAISMLKECQALLREVEGNYDLFMASVTAGLDQEIDRISMHFVGLKNFQTLFTDSRFPYSIYKTILFVFTSVPLKVAVGVFLAFLLSSPMIYGRRVMRAALLVPWAIPILLSVTTWRMMMAPGIGPIANFLSRIGVDFSIYTREWDAFLAYNIVEMWLAYPFIMTVTMAAIASIPRELIESAMVDGATAWQRFKDVMLPLTSRPILFASVLTAGASLQAFMVPLLINGGGPTKELQFLWFSRTTGAVNEMMVLFGYNRAYLDQQYGLSAAAYLVVVFTLLLYALGWYYLLYKRASPGGA